MNEIVSFRNMEPSENRSQEFTLQIVISWMLKHSPRMLDTQLSHQSDGIQLETRRPSF